MGNWVDVVQTGKTSILLWVRNQPTAGVGMESSESSGRQTANRDGIGSSAWAEGWSKRDGRNAMPRLHWLAMLRRGSKRHQWKYTTYILHMAASERIGALKELSLVDDEEVREKST